MSSFGASESADADRVIPVNPINPQARACLECHVRRHALFGVLDALALDRIHYRIADVQIEPGQRLYGVHELGSSAFTVREGVVPVGMGVESALEMTRKATVRVVCTR